MALAGHRSVQTVMMPSQEHDGDQLQADPAGVRAREGPNNYYRAGEVGKSRANRLIGTKEPEG
jgi:hypothetical protein